MHLSSTYAFNDFKNIWLVYLSYYQHYTIIAVLGQYDELATLKVQYSPRLRLGEYCTSRVAKSSY